MEHSDLVKAQRKIRFGQRDVTLLVSNEFIKITIESPEIDESIYSGIYYKNEIETLTNGVCSDIQTLETCLENGLNHKDPNINIKFSDDAKLHVTIEYEILKKKLQHKFSLSLQREEDISLKALEIKVKEQAQIILKQEARIKILEDKNKILENKTNNLETSVFELKSIIDKLLLVKEASNLMNKEFKISSQKEVNVQEEPQKISKSFSFDQTSKNCSGQYRLSNQNKFAQKTGDSYTILYCNDQLDSLSKIKFRIENLEVPYFFLGICFNENHNSTEMSYNSDGFYGLNLADNSIYCNGTSVKTNDFRQIRSNDVIEVMYDPSKLQVEWSHNGKWLYTQAIENKRSQRKCFFMVLLIHKGLAVSIVD